MHWIPPLMLSAFHQLVSFPHIHSSPFCKKWVQVGFNISVCISDLFENVVTFRKTDATIEFPTFEGATSGDIRFQFKTTQESGIFLQNTGTYHFIEVKLVCKYSMELSKKKIPLTLKVLNFWKFTSYCSLKPLWLGIGEVVPARTSPILHPLSPPTVHQLFNKQEFVYLLPMKTVVSKERGWVGLTSNNFDKRIFLCCHFVTLQC